MGRSGYSDDFGMEYDNQAELYRNAVERSIRGKRGQAFLRDLLAALDALPQKRLIADDLERDGEVCAIGSLGLRRGIDMSGLDPEDAETIAKTFGVAPALVRELEWENDDEEGWQHYDTPEQRFEHVRKWVVENLAKSK